MLVIVSLFLAISKYCPYFIEIKLTTLTDFQTTYEVAKELTQEEGILPLYSLTSTTQILHLRHKMLSCTEIPMLSLF